jgi:hypothetical protein
VLTDIRGQTGQHILGAVVRGEEDPTVLANMALRRAANKRDALVLALRGRVNDHHRLLLRGYCQDIMLQRRTTLYENARQ